VTTGLGWSPVAYRLGRRFTAIDRRQGRAVGSRHCRWVLAGRRGSHGVEEAGGDLRPSDEKKLNSMLDGRAFGLRADEWPRLT